MSFRSPLAEVYLPEITLPQYVLQHAQARGGKAALIDGTSGRTISYAQLRANVRHVAKSLVQRGYRKGDRFAIYSPNLPEYAIAFHAIATLGGIVTTVNPLATRTELAYQLQDAEVKCLLTTGPLLDQAQRAAAQSAVRELFTFDQVVKAKPFAELCESLLAADELPSDALIEPRRDLVALPYARNTAGRLQGLPRTHYNLVAKLAQFGAAEDLAEDEVLLGVLPFFEGYSLLLLLNYALVCGATVVTLPRCEPELLLATLPKYRVTRAPLAPSQARELAQSAAVERYDQSVWWRLYTGHNLAGKKSLEFKL